MKRWLRCLLGIHNLSATNWGYGFGQLDLFCTRCQKCVLSLNIGRLAPLAVSDAVPGKGAE